MLKNPRHERFAQELAKGKSATEAYREAGYKEDRPHASRLATNGNVRARVAELQARIVTDVQLSREWVIEQLIDNARLAKAAEDFGPANRALELLGKELNMFVDKSEVGQPGDFDLTMEQKRDRAIALAKQLGLSSLSPVSGTA